MQLGEVVVYERQSIAGAQYMIPTRRDACLPSPGSRDIEKPRLRRCVSLPTRQRGLSPELQDWGPALLAGGLSSHCSFPVTFRYGKEFNMKDTSKNLSKPTW